MNIYIQLLISILGLVHSLNGEKKMAITQFNKTFGKTAPAATANSDKPKAQFWLNIGYAVDVQSEEGPMTKFVSLPTGIPLDTQEELPTNSSNEEFRMLRLAQNDLLEQLNAFAQTLQPGEERILDLQIQLRRVKGEQAPVAASDNPFIAKLNFGS